MSLDGKEKRTIYTLFSPSLNFQQLNAVGNAKKKLKHSFTPNTPPTTFTLHGDKLTHPQVLISSKMPP
jgi:hypothetical protein